MTIALNGIVLLLLLAFFTQCEKTVNKNETLPLKATEQNRSKHSNQSDSPILFKDEPIRVITESNRLKRIAKPVYPAEAKRRGVEGKVVVKVIIDRDGAVIKADAISGDPLLRRASELAALQCQFEPLLLNGKKLSLTEEMIVFKFIFSGTPIIKKGIK